MRRPDRKRIWPLAIGAICLCTALPLKAGVYFWTDENGVRHYSNVAPPETEREIERLDEIPPSAPKAPVPADTLETAPQPPTASEEKGPEEEPAAAGPEARTEPAQEDSREPAPGPRPVPTKQDEIVSSEKKIVGELRRRLEQNASRRDQIIQSERRRLGRAIEQLQKTPLSEFGSQKNKTRAVGYYRYRLQALQDSPDTYFQYGDSDID